jgi:acyl carrier protein
MKRRRCSFVAVVFVIVGCTTNTDLPKAANNQASHDAAEKVVRAVLAERMKIDASAIPMEKSISDPPLKADELDLIEIVMDLEERQGIEITDAAIEKCMGGKLGVVAVRITPNQLVMVVREAPKLDLAKRRK